MERKKFIDKIILLTKGGFFHLFFSNILNKIFLFCGGIFLVRVITKDDYGIYSYINNILSFFLLINGFGITEGLLQYGSKCVSAEEKISYIKYSLKIGFFSNILLVICIVFYYFYGNFKITEGRNFFLMLIGFPILNFIFSILQIKLRIEFKNKKLAKFSNLNTLLNLFGMILGGYIDNLKGVIIGKYIGNFISILVFSNEMKEIVLNWKKINNLLDYKKKNILKFSLISMLTGTFTQLLYIIDIFLIGIIIGEKSIIASYKTATLIPFALLFIPLTIFSYIYPYFSKNSENILWIKRKYIEILKYISILNLFITICMIVFSGIIIKIVFGENYIDSINTFKVLSIGYFFAGTLRIPALNVINALGKIKFNLYNSIISGISNIVLNIIFIKLYGSIGAAYTTLLIFIISGGLGNIFLLKFLNK